DEGKPMGLLMGADPITTLSQRLVQTKLEGGWNILLIDQNGHLAARKDISTSSNVVDLSGFEPVQRLRAGAGGYGTFDMSDELQLIRYDPISAYGWGVLVQQPSALLQQKTWAVQKRILVLGMVFVIAGLLISKILQSLYAQLESGNRF